MNRIWTIDVESTSIPASLLAALTVGGTKYVVRPLSHAADGGGTKGLATVYNVDQRPLFQDHGGLHAVRDAVSAAFQAAVPDRETERVQTLYCDAMSDWALPRLFASATVCETDKNMGPVIVSRRWLDSRKLDTVRGPGFQRIGKYDVDTAEWRFVLRDPNADLAGHPLDRPILGCVDDDLPVGSYATGTLSEMTAASTDVFLAAVSLYRGPTVPIDPPGERRTRPDRPTLVDLVTPLPGQNHLGEMGALPKVHKRPADSRPVVDLSDTNQLRASVLVHLALLDLIAAAKKRWPNVLDVIDGETSTSIDLFEARLRAVASTGIDPSTVRFTTADFEAMYTNLNWPQAIGWVRELAASVGWTPATIITVRRKEPIPRGRHPGGCRSGLKEPDSSEVVQLTFGEVLHLLQCVCRYGLFVCITQFGSWLVETVGSILMGTQMAPELANAVGAAARMRLVREVFDGTAPSFTRQDDASDNFRIVRCPFTNTEQLYHSARYIDDLAELLWGTAAEQDDMSFWITSWYTARTGLNLVFADSRLEWVPWLALEINRSPEEGRFRFRPYSKPGNVFALTHFTSYVPEGAKVGLVIGQALAAEKRSDNEHDMRCTWRMSELRLLQKGYPQSFIDRTLRRWLAKRFAGGARRRSFHSVLSQDLLGESFVVIDHAESFRPQEVRRQISALMGIECQVAVRYYSSVGDTLRGLSKKADPLTTLRRQRRAEVPAEVAAIWAD